MGVVYFTSDIHDGHRNIGNYRCLIEPSVVDIMSNREFIRSHWRANKHDTVYMLGDICFAKDSIEFINSLPGNKVLILGNHDLENSSRPTMYEYLAVFSKVLSTLNRKGYTMSHIPLHPNELRNRKCIHGHIHSMEKDYMNLDTPKYDERFINVNIDVLWPRTGKIMLNQEEFDEYTKGYRSR